MTLIEVRILEDWASAWSSHDPDRIITLYTDDCVFDDVPFGLTIRGKNELRSLAANAFGAIPDLQVKLTNAFGVDGRAVAEWVHSGTHRGDLPGMPATGRGFKTRGASVFELQSGRIHLETDYWDTTTFMRQVGLLPAV